MASWGAPFIMAAKKKSTKKVAKKKPAKKVVKKTSGKFDALADGLDFAETVKAGMEKVLLRRTGRRVDFSSQSEVRQSQLPIRSFYLQWALNSRGIPAQSTFEVIGKDKLGKTSFIYNLMGGFMEEGSPCAIIVGENKPLTPAWAARCFHADPNTARKMCELLHVIKSSNLDEMHELLMTWLKVCRDPTSSAFVPMDTPLVLAIDPWGKLLTKSESKGVYSYGKLADEKEKGISEGSNFERSKWNAEWSRKLPALQREYNFLLIIANHQNVKLDMKGGMPSYLPQSAIDLQNRTKSGGEATNQIAATQLIMLESGGVKCRDQRVAKKIRVRVYKNSYGPDGREFYTTLRHECYDDAPGYLDSAINHWLAMLPWFVDNSFLDFSETAKRFTCHTLGIVSQDALEASRAMASHPDMPDILERLGEQLKIEGYVDTYKRIVEELTQLPPDPTKALDQVEEKEGEDA